jgi:hypothetical protein
MNREKKENNFLSSQGHLKQIIMPLVAYKSYKIIVNSLNRSQNPQGQKEAKNQCETFDISLLNSFTGDIL